MTFAEILPHIINHEYVRRKDWGENNAMVLSDDNQECFYFKMFKDTKLPIIGPHALFPICEDEDYGNEKYHFSLPEIIAEDWEIFDDSNLKECGFLIRHLNKATERQLLTLMAIQKIESDFEKMSYEEKLSLHEKYPDLITVTN